MDTLALIRAYGDAQLQAGVMDGRARTDADPVKCLRNAVTWDIQGECLWSRIADIPINSDILGEIHAYGRKMYRSGLNLGESVNARGTLKADFLDNYHHWYISSVSDFSEIQAKIS